MQLKLTGALELERTLTNLAPKVRKKHVRSCLKTALAPVASRAKSLCRSKTVASAIAVVGAKADRKGGIAMKVGFRRSKKLLYTTKSGEVYHLGAIEEFGHAAPYANVPKGHVAKTGDRKHKTNSKAKVVGPHSFIRAAGDALGNQAENRALQLIAAGVAEEFK